MSEAMEMPGPEIPAAAALAGNRFARAHYVLLYFVAAALVAWILSGFYQVKFNEVGIVERLGAYLSNPDGKIIQVRAGLHYHLPWPIDRVQIVSNSQALNLTVDAFNASPSKYLEMKQEFQKQGAPMDVINALFDPYLITADKSIVNMEIKLTYVINDPTLWLTTVSHEADVAGAPNDMRDQLFQQLAQRSMVHLLNHNTLEDLLFNNQARLPQDMLETVRKNFVLSEPENWGDKSAHEHDLGIEIQKVDVAFIGAPQAVRPAFDRVTNARQQLKVLAASAEAAATSVLNQANAEISTLVAEARSYAARTVGAAQGEHDQFEQILQQYKNAPDVVSWNLWVDAVNTVSGPAVRHFFVQPGQRTILTIDPPKFDAGQVQPKQP